MTIKLGVVDGKQREKLEEHQRVPFGFLKAAVILILVLAFIAIIGKTIHQLYILQTPIVSGQGAYSIFILALCVIACLIILYSKRDLDGVAVIQRYWRNNVIGYTADFMRENGDLQVWINPRRSDLGPGAYTRLIIRVPLGGWFRSRRCRIYHSRDLVGRSWTITRTARPDEFLRVKPRGDYAIRLFHREVLPTWLLLQLVQDRLIYCRMSDPDWWMLIKSLWEQKEAWRIKLETTVRQHTEEALRARSPDIRVLALEDILEKTIVEIDASKRFIKSKEGEAIRTRLAKRFYLLLRDDDPRKKRYNTSGQEL